MGIEGVIMPQRVVPFGATEFAGVDKIAKMENGAVQLQSMERLAAFVYCPAVL